MAESSKVYMATDYSIRFNFSPCLHRHVKTVITGGMHFSGGVLWDDIQENLLCLDCGEYVSEQEVRARWSGPSAQSDVDIDF